MAQGKREVLRRCAGCQQMKDKKDLLRVIRTPEGAVLIDPGKRANGRGVYVCISSECLAQARRRGSLQKALKTAMPETIWEELDQLVRSSQTADTEEI